MTPEQEVSVLRQTLVQDEELTRLLRAAAKHWADTTLRSAYQTSDAAALIRSAALAEGVERFVADITKPPVRARKTVPPPSR